ncbi:MAG: hypothetical protein IKX04_10645, partial [Clostridiales bacterium]|nr:hypothetical protein [Clostridiales bacterium]
LIRGRVQVEDEAVKLILEDCVPLSRDSEELCQLPPARSGGYGNNRRPKFDTSAPMSGRPSEPQPDISEAPLPEGISAAPASADDSGSDASESAASGEAAPKKEEPRNPNAPRLAIRYFGNVDDDGYKRLLSTCQYFHGGVPVYVALPKEKRNVRLSPEYSIEWSRDVCEILVKEYGIENVSLF